jgi:hypothetical protein
VIGSASRAGGRGPGAWRWTVALVLWALAVWPASGQALRFGNHRRIEIPEYATVRIGPFYSSVAFSQMAGFRYTTATGAGTDFLKESGRGKIRDDGLEVPLISTLDFRNYLLISRSVDLDMSVRVSYEHYPMGTQDDEFSVILAEEGIEGVFSTEFRLSETARGTAYDSMVYRTDYIDSRGLADEYGGFRNRYFRNVLGVNLDWLLAPRQNLGISVSREDFYSMEKYFEDLNRGAFHESLTYEVAVVPDVGVGARAGWTQTDYYDRKRADTVVADYGAFVRFSRGDEGGARVRLTERSTLTLGVGYSVGYGRTTSTQVTPDQQTTGEYDDSAAAMTGNAKLTTQMRKDLSHSFEYRRSLGGGFRSPMQLSDVYEYRLDWKGVFASAYGFSRAAMGQPVGRNIPDYSDWASGLGGRYPLWRGVDLVGDTTYSTRHNLGKFFGAVDLEQANNYDTWVFRLGTSFALTRRVDFNTYYQHMERWSGEDALAYERDTFEAVARYFRQF